MSERQNECPVQNTDRELWREPHPDPPESYYANSIHVTAQGGIGINVGGTVIVLPLEQWHRLALEKPAPAAASERNRDLPEDRCGGDGTYPYVAVSEPTRAADGPTYCGDCKHPAHSGPCPILHFYDRPGGPPGNQQCMCGHNWQPASPAQAERPLAETVTYKGVLLSEIPEMAAKIERLEAELAERPRLTREQALDLVQEDGPFIIARLRQLGIEVEG